MANQQLKSKYEKLKADQPSILISKGSVGLIRFFSIFYITGSVVGIVYAAAKLVGLLAAIALIEQQMNDRQVEQAIAEKLLGVDKDMVYYYVLLIFVLLFLMTASIIIRIFGSKINRRNNYIRDLDKVASEAIEG